MTHGRRKYLLALLALLIVQAAANALLLHRHPDLINNVPHDLLMDGLERIRGEPIVLPQEQSYDVFFYEFPAHVLPALGLVSEFGFKLSTTAYWLAALALLFVAGTIARDERAGLWAALTFTGFVFANNFSRAFDVHVPRMMWELAAFAPLAAWMRYGGAVWPLAALPAVYLGLLYTVTPSDGPLFLIGIAGPAAAAVFVRWRKLRERSRAWYYAAGFALAFAVWRVFHAIWHSPAFNTSHFMKEAVRGEFLSGGWADIPRHLVAYPAYLGSCALGLPMLFLALAAFVAEARTRAGTRRYWLAGALFPILLLTLVPKKNPHYVDVALPFIALGVGLGIAELSRKRLWVSAAALLVILAANAGTWLGVRQDAPLGRIESVFQFTGPFNYLARPLDDITIKRRESLRRVAGETCAPSAPCRVAMFGTIPDETQIFLPVAEAYPLAKLVRVLQHRGRETAWDFEILWINTASFSADLRTPFGEVDMNDLNAVAAEIDKRVEALNRKGIYVNGARAAMARFAGRVKYAGRFEGLDYYR